MEVLEHRPPLVTRVLVGVLLLALVAGCGTSNAGPLASLRSMEEATLFYPGSTQLGELAQDERQGSITGAIAAEFGHQLGSQASSEDIARFYEVELAKRGWADATSLVGITVGIRDSTESSARAWEKGDAFFRLSFRRRDDQGRLPSSVLKQFATIYETTVIHKQQTVEPKPSMTP